MDLNLGKSRGKGVDYVLLFRPMSPEEKAQRWNDRNKRWKKRETDKTGKELAYQDFLYFCIPKMPEELNTYPAELVFNQFLLEFRKRWGIETGYRVTKGIWGWTTTTHYTLRYWLMWQAVLIFNLWTLENAELISEQRIPPEYRCCDLPTTDEVKDDEFKRRFKNLPPSMRQSREYPSREWFPIPIEPMRLFGDILMDIARKIYQDIIAGVDPPNEKMEAPVS